MSPSRYPFAPRSLVAVVTRLLNGNQLVPSNLSASEKVGGEDDDEVLDAMYNVESCRRKYSSTKVSFESQSNRGSS